MSYNSDIELIISFLKVKATKGAIILKTTYICLLPVKTQNAIKKDLESLGLRKEDIENGMAGKLCDLEDIIDITKYLIK